MAIIKILRCRGQSGSSALDYVIYKHDESSRAPVLDESGNRELRDDFYLSGINCAPLAFPTEMIQLESIWGKNLEPEDIRMYQIIVSYDPKDAEEYILDGPRAQMLSMTLVRRCFTGTLGIACTHLDGDHHSGNIHTHVFLSSIQYSDEIAINMKYPIAEKAGDKLDFSKAATIEIREHMAVIVQKERLHPNNLFQIAGDRISNGEYWANYRGQIRLDQENQRLQEIGVEVVDTRFRGRKQMLREALKDAMFQSVSVEEFRDQLETQYQVKITESGEFWRFGFVGDDQDYASSTLGANFYKEEICRVMEHNRRHPEHMEEYLAEKMQSQKTEKVFPKPDITTLSGCREVFQASKGDPPLVASIRKLARGMERTESPETLQEKWTPLASSVQFVSEHKIWSMAQLKTLEETLRGSAAYYHERKLEKNLILRDKINILHYSEVVEQHSKTYLSNMENTNAGSYSVEPKQMQEVEDAIRFFKNAGIARPMSAKKAWEDKMTAQRITDRYGELEAKTRGDIQSLKEVRAVLNSWKELLPSALIPVTQMLEVITPRNIQSRENLLCSYLTKDQSTRDGLGIKLENSASVTREYVLTGNSESETLPMAVGMGSVSCDYILWNESEDAPEKSVTDRAGEQKGTEPAMTLEERHYERIRKLMERRNAASDVGTAAGRTGREGKNNTTALIDEARAGIYRAEAIEKDSRAERDNKIAQRADRDAARERRKAKNRTRDDRER
ncbi:MAG: hypothetical protein IIY45_02975 [Firmicutes bacterium]|nr:hypothetical protein [Bacillota bacterium]